MGRMTPIDPSVSLSLSAITNSSKVNWMLLILIHYTIQYILMEDQTSLRLPLSIFTTLPLLAIKVTKHLRLKWPLSQYQLHCWTIWRQTYQNLTFYHSRQFPIHNCVHCSVSNHILLQHYFMLGLEVFGYTRNN